jgi:hypothetical protein
VVPCFNLCPLRVETSHIGVFFFSRKEAKALALGISFERSIFICEAELRVLGSAASPGKAKINGNGGINSNDI